jgi:hypothetical protein
MALFSVEVSLVSKNPQTKAKLNRLEQQLRVNNILLEEKNTNELGEGTWFLHYSDVHLSDSEVQPLETKLLWLLVSDCLGLDFNNYIQFITVNVIKRDLSGAVDSPDGLTA